MGDIIMYDRGCRGCMCMERAGQKTYVCNARVHMDDSPVIPIKDGIKTSDWNICDGADYERNSGWKHSVNAR